MFELSDANPAKLHMTVPASFRRHSKVPGILSLHKGVLTKADIQERAGYYVTSPARTVQDLLQEGATDLEIIQQAVSQAWQRGLIVRKDVEGLAGLFPNEHYLFDRILKKAQ
jgi:hypothetical protein